LEDLYEDFLSQILGFLGSAGKSIAQIIDFPGVGPEQPFPGRVFAGEAPLK
jgi:hypothetical protein